MTTAGGAAFSDADYPARPYPGARPACSFVHLAGVGYPIEHGRVEGERLDDWLVAHDQLPIGAREPVLAYGSNANPSKITWLRQAHGLRGPVVVRRVRTAGLAAVWAAGFRMVDEQRPATLAAMPGVVEQHAIWLATPEQLAVLDVCEGRGDRYDLARVHTGTVTTDDGAAVIPLAYVGRAETRMPLLVDGIMVRCADVPQTVAKTMVGVPGQVPRTRRCRPRLPAVVSTACPTACPSRCCTTASW